MRARTVNYFVGSLFSVQAIYAYGIAGGITTALQGILIWRDVLLFKAASADLPLLLELYIETLIPIWIPPVTPWNVMILGVNICLALMIIGNWAMKYSQSY
jgi:hypothetical protein